MALVEIILLIIFILFLYKAAEMVVDNAVKLANFFRITTLAAGIVLVAISTALPELSVAIMSSINNEGSIAVGNSFGSLIANILLLLGLGAFLYGFRIENQSLKSIALLLFLTTLISLYILAHSLFYGSALGLIEGVILLGIGVVYYFKVINESRLPGEQDAYRVTKHEALSSFILFFLGFVGVIFFAGLVVKYAVLIARQLNVSESFIGATMIAVGTSLPELSVVLQAIRKKHYGIALGDVMGSNMANLTLVLGCASIINPISLVNLLVPTAAMLFAVVANSTFLYFSITKKRFTYREGLVMLAMYAFYIFVIFGLQAGELVLRQ